MVYSKKQKERKEMGLCIDCEAQVKGSVRCSDCNKKMYERIRAGKSQKNPRNISKTPPISEIESAYKSQDKIVASLKEACRIAGHPYESLHTWMTYNNYRFIGGKFKKVRHGK